MIAVVHASVAVKWFLQGNPDEQHADLALRLLEQSVLGLLTMVQPEHFVAEVAAVLARLKPGDAPDDLMDFLDINFRTLSSPETYATALDLALRYQHTCLTRCTTRWHCTPLTRCWSRRMSATTTKPGRRVKSACWQISGSRDWGGDVVLGNLDAIF